MEDLNSLINSALSSAEEEDILICPDCGQPKQVRIELPWCPEGRLMPCLCECETKSKEAELAKIKEKEQLIRLRGLQKAAFVDDAYMGMTFKSDLYPSSQNSMLAHRYINGFEKAYESGTGLILYGKPGTGKTFMAACIANSLLLKGHSVWMIKFPTLLAQIQREKFKTDFSELVKSFDLFILDDLGVERKTDFGLEQVFNVIDDRYLSGKPMIITSNLSLKEMKEPSTLHGERIYSRILEKCFPMEFSGKDRRKTKNCYNAMMDILAE